MAQMQNTSIYLRDLEDKIDARNPKSRSQYIRGGIRMRFEIEDAADAAGGDLPDDWWRDELYDAMRSAAERRVREQRERELEAEADD